MSNELYMYDHFMSVGFNDLQSRAFVNAFETLEDKVAMKTNSIEAKTENKFEFIEKDISDIKSCIVRIETMFDSLEKMIYGLGAFMAAGFALIIYVVKG